MASQKTLEELVPEVKDKIGILIFRWGIKKSRIGRRIGLLRMYTT